MVLLRCKKNFIFLFVFLAFLTEASFAKIFEFSASGGIRSSKVQEFVYEDDYTLSRLDWKAPLIPVIGLSGRFDIFHTILDFSVDSAIPVKLGSIQDYDWTGTDKSKNTHFSDHELIVNRLFDLEAKAGYDFNLKNFGVPVDLSIIPQAGFLFRSQKFEAYNGYTQYAGNGEYWSDSLEKTYISGVGMTYEVASYMPFLSLESEYAIDSFWKVRIFGRFFPYIYSAATDNHILKYVQYNDYMKEGMGFSIGSEAGWKNFSLMFSYEWFKCDEGDTYYRTIGEENSFIESKTTPGVKSSVFSLMFVYKV